MVEQLSPQPFRAVIPALAQTTSLNDAPIILRHTAR
jgi:hypothetical protein